MGRSLARRSNLSSRLMAEGFRHVLCVRLISLILIILTASGCSKSTVADDLAQRDANEIVAVLRGQGIEASTEKERGGRGRYSVSVASSRFGEAASILTEKGLPADRKATFSELVAQSGILPSSREVEALRLDRAVASEIEDLVKGHPSIAAVTAIVRYHSIEGSAAPSVSLVVQKRAGAPLNVAEVRDMVARVVPGVRSEDIVISITEQAQPSAGKPADDGDGRELVPFLGLWKVPAGEYNGLAMMMIGLLLVVAFMSALAGYIFGQYLLSRQEEEQNYDVLEGEAPLEKLSSPGEHTEASE